MNEDYDVDATMRLRETKICELQQTIAQKDARIDELLAANNQYLQRARDAEARVKRLEGTIECRNQAGVGSL
jgi:hypothetical protein